MLDIEKLCEEFHKIIGRDKTVKISILEGDTEEMTGWVTGTIKPEVWEEIRNLPKKEKPKPFLKIAKGSGVEYSYLGSSKSTDK